MAHQQHTAHRPTSGPAIASLVLGIASLLCLFLLWVPAIVGTILGIVGIRHTGPTGTRTGRGLAITGTTINGALAILAPVVIITMISSID